MARSASYYQKTFPNTRVEGLEEVIVNLNKEIAGIKARSLRGLVLSAAHIRRETETNPPLTPVDTGNLRASWFVVTAKSIPVGQASGGKFKGKKAEKMEVEHASTLAEAQAMAQAKSVLGKEFIILGYSANYGIFVHEKFDMHDPSNPYWRTRKWRPGSGPKWLQQAIERSKKRILEIVRDNAQIGR